MIVEVFLILFVLHIIFGIILWLKVKDFYQQPGLLGIPILGNLYYFYRTLGFTSMSSMVTYYNRVAKNYGKDVCFHWMHGKMAVIISCPHLIEEICFHPKLADKPRMMYGGFSGYMDGLFAHPAADREWKVRRKEMNIAMKSSNIEGPFHNDFVKAAKRFVEQLIGCLALNQISCLTMHFTLNATLGTHFHITESSISLDIAKVIDRISSKGSFSLANPYVGGLAVRIVKLSEKFLFHELAFYKALAIKTIEEKLKNVEESSRVLSDLPISAIVWQRNKKMKKVDDDIDKEFVELLLVGSHTVAHTLNNMLFFLGTLPELQEKAWLEQFEIFENDNRDPTIGDLKQMIYLERFIKEVLRFTSPPLISKMTSGNIFLGGTIIPSDTVVVFLVGKVQMDPLFWKNPEEFDPERFLHINQNRKYAYIPFGIGNRSCPGKLYAMSEVKVVLSTLLRRIKVSCCRRFKDLHLYAQFINEISNSPPLHFQRRQLH